MKKVNLLSRAEMKNVMGGLASVGSTSCLQECTLAEVGLKCDGGGLCTFYAATTECPGGQRACIV